MTQLGVTFASGYTAGVICAIVSHPADSLVSLLGKPANKGKSLGQIINETGFAKLATKVTISTQWPYQSHRQFTSLNEYF